MLLPYGPVSYTHLDVYKRQPYTAETLSDEHKIPIRLTKKILYELQDMHMVYETSMDGDDESKMCIRDRIITQSATIDDMLGLFGDIRFVRLQIKFIPYATELISGMIFQTDTAELRRTCLLYTSRCV